jgi:ETFB lysine methyltransferase
MSTLRVRYQTLEFGDVDIHLRTLRDLQEFSDDDNVAGKLGISSASWPLFGVLWDAGAVLAHQMANYEIGDRRVLEVGCGLALASLVLNKREVDVTAMDYHPEVAGFLAANVELNDGAAIPFVRASWDDPDCGLGEFDLIIGADILYERAHVAQLSSFIDRHAAPTCEVVVVDAGREERGRFSTAMVALGFEAERFKPKQTAYLTKPFGGEILRFTR